MSGMRRRMLFRISAEPEKQERVNERVWRRRLGARVDKGSSELGSALGSSSSSWFSGYISFLNLSHIGLICSGLPTLKCVNTCLGEIPKLGKTCARARAVCWSWSRGT